MSHDRSTVEAVVKHYFDGLYEGDADKLGAIFHPTADLRWLEKGELQVLTVPDWLDRVRKRPSAKAEGKPREDFIVTIDRSDDHTAFIKVRCQLPPRYFTDYLVAMKLARRLEDRFEILPLRSARMRTIQTASTGLGLLREHRLAGDAARGLVTKLQYRNRPCPWRRRPRIDLAGFPCELGAIMEAKFQIFLILLAVLAGTALLARRINVAPAILLLLAGIALAFVPGMPSVELPPEVVLLLVLPPLIYSASVAMSWREFKFNLRPIILLSVGCVIFTAFAVAAATHYLIGLPWSVGFLLGAIVAPPDVVAPLAIARKLGMPRRILVVLEGEGLANDATALILYRFAVAAISTGMFSLPQGSRHIRRHRRRRIAVRRGRRLAQLAGAPPRARSAGRDHAVADHALHRLLDPRAFRRLRRDRDRRLRALYELERAAVDLVRDASAGHLLLGPRDLPDRGLAVPADGIPDAAAVREIEGVSARRYPVRDRAGRRSLSSSRVLPGSIPQPICRASSASACANAIHAAMAQCVS